MGPVKRPKLFTVTLPRFTKSAGCIISEGVSKETVKNAADTSKVKLRGKFDVFAETLKKEEVPLLVFSAGVGQVIERVSTDYFTSSNANLLSILK